MSIYSFLMVLNFEKKGEIDIYYKIELQKLRKEEQVIYEKKIDTKCEMSQAH